MVASASSTLPPTCYATLSAPSPAPSTRTPPLGLILHLFSSKNNLTHSPDLSIFSATSHLTTESAQQTKTTIFMATPFLSAEMKYMIILINEAIDEIASKSFGTRILMFPVHDDVPSVISVLSVDLICAPLCQSPLLQCLCAICLCFNFLCGWLSFHSGTFASFSMYLSSPRSCNTAKSLPLHQLLDLAIPIRIFVRST